MTDAELADLIRIIRRAPLHNMDEAEAVGRLMQKVIAAFRPPERKTDEAPPFPFRVVE